MPGGKPPQTPEQQSLRLRGYELYLIPDKEGRRRSFRAIAMTLGVTFGTVLYWRKKDKWDERVSAALHTQTVAAQVSIERGQGIAALLRASLHEHIGTLNSLIRDTTQKASVRLAAIRELADICLKLKAIDPADLMPIKPRRDLSFKDDLHGPETELPSDVQHDSVPAGTDSHDDDDPPAAASSGLPDGSDGGSGGGGLGSESFAPGWSDGAGSDPTGSHD